MRAEAAISGEPWRRPLLAVTRPLDWYWFMNPALAYQLERIRAMSVEEKLRISHELWLEARAVLAAGVRARHPEWTEAPVAERVRELMLEAQE